MRERLQPGEVAWGEEVPLELCVCSKCEGCALKCEAEVSEEAE